MPTRRNDRGQRLKASDTEETHTDGPVRQCAVTRESWTQDALIRFVRSPDGMAVPDIAGKRVWVYSMSSRDRTEDLMLTP